MANSYKFEDKAQRVDRMHQANPNKSRELCEAVVTDAWTKRMAVVRENIPERFSTATMENLPGELRESIDYGINEILKPKEENSTVGLIFCGPPGAGKTYASYAVIDYFLKKNPEMVGYITNHSEAFSQLRTEFFKGSHENIGSVWDKLTNSSGFYGGVLFFDDLSSKNLTDFELDKLLLLLERRFNYYLPFIITTNIQQSKFSEVFGERISSRFLGYCEVVDFTGDKRVDLTNK